MWVSSRGMKNICRVSRLLNSWCLNLLDLIKSKMCQCVGCRRHGFDLLGLNRRPFTVDEDHVSCRLCLYADCGELTFVLCSLINVRDS